jgi:hypothetical protein
LNCFNLHTEARSSVSDELAVHCVARLIRVALRAKL